MLYRIIIFFIEYIISVFLSWGCGGSEKSRLCVYAVHGLHALAFALGAFSADSTGELDVLGHDGDPLGVDGTQIGVLEQTDQIGLAGFLKGHHGRALEA